MPDPGSYGQTSTTTAPVGNGSAPAPSIPTNPDSFPTTPSGTGLGTNGLNVDLAQISVNQFLSDFNISSGEEATFVTQGANGQPALTQNARFLMQFKAMDAVERETYQQELVNAGLLPQSAANGILNTTSLSAFKSAIANSDQQGMAVDEYLNQYSGTNNAGQAIAKAASNAQQEAQAPVVVTNENPTTLAQTISSAFDQALGYAPSQAQVNAFISQVHGQDAAVAEAPHQAAMQQLSQLKSEGSTLEKMGPDGITAIVNAYANAIHGANPAAGGAQPTNQSQVVRGPATGTALAPGVENNNPSGMMFGPATSPPVQKTAEHPFGVLGAALHDFGVLSLGTGSKQGFVTPGTESAATYSKAGKVPGMIGAPEQALGTPGTVPTYGGFFSLSPASWTEAKKLFPAAAKYDSAGAAPFAIQLGAFTQLLQTAHDNNGGSWTDAIIEVAGGDPKKAGKETVPGTKSNLNSFAVGVANEVNNQLTQLTNQANNADVTVHTTSPDASGEAAQETKQADPVGYLANNFASFGSLAQKMLYGTPLADMQSTADTFTGPPGNISQLSGGAPSAPPASAPPPAAPTGATTAAAVNAPTANGPVV